MDIDSFLFAQDNFMFHFEMNSVLTLARKSCLHEFKTRKSLEVTTKKLSRVMSHLAQHSGKIGVQQANDLSWLGVWVFDSRLRQFGREILVEIFLL